MIGELVIFLSLFGKECGVCRRSCACGQIHKCVLDTPHQDESTMVELRSFKARSSLELVAWRL